MGDGQKGPALESSVLALSNLRALLLQVDYVRAKRVFAPTRGRVCIKIALIAPNSPPRRGGGVYATTHRWQTTPRRVSQLLQGRWMPRNAAARIYRS